MVIILQSSYTTTVLTLKQHLHCVLKHAITEQMIDRWRADRLGNRQSTDRWRTNHNVPPYLRMPYNEKMYCAELLFTLL